MKINTKTKLKLIIIMFSITMFITTIFSTTVLAANLNVNVEFDGKKIEMTSETPEMEWNINNVLPGQSMETLLIINSTGSKEVKVELGAEITDNPKLTEELIIKILNNKTSETLYEGKISELENVTLKIPSKETSQLKVMISIPEEASNEIQNDNYTVKFKLVAKGEKKILGNIQEDSEEAEEAEEEIKTDIINKIQTKESRAIFIVLAILVIVLIIFLIFLYKFWE